MITLEDLKLYLQIAADEQNGFLQKCINNAERYIYSYCNRKFIAGSYTEPIKIFRDELWNNFFYVRVIPITTVTKIEYLSDDNTWTELTDPSIGILSDEGKIFIDDDLSTYKMARVTYTGGYAIDDIPFDLQQACIMLSASYYFESGQGEKRLGINARNWNSQVSEGATYKDVEEKANKILDKYRLYNI